MNHLNYFFWSIFLLLPSLSIAQEQQRILELEGRHLRAARECLKQSQFGYFTRQAQGKHVLVCAEGEVPTPVFESEQYCFRNEWLQLNSQVSAQGNPQAYCWSSKQQSDEELTSLVRAQTLWVHLHLARHYLQQQPGYRAILAEQERQQPLLQIYFNLDPRKEAPGQAFHSHAQTKEQGEQISIHFYLPLVVKLKQSTLGQILEGRSVKNSIMVPIYYSQSLQEISNLVRFYQLKEIYGPEVSLRYDPTTFLFTILAAQGLVEGLPLLFKTLRKIAPAQVFFDGSLMPEVIYHEYVHVALAPRLGITESMIMNESIANYLSLNILQAQGIQLEQMGRGTAYQRGRELPSARLTPGLQDMDYHPHLERLSRTVHGSLGLKYFIYLEQLFTPQDVELLLAHLLEVQLKTYRSEFRTNELTVPWVMKLILEQFKNAELWPEVEVTRLSARVKQHLYGAAGSTLFTSHLSEREQLIQYFQLAFQHRFSL